MKTFVNALLCFTVFLTAGRLSAQETFARLVSEDCLAFAHVDFGKVEIDAVKNTLRNAAEGMLRKLGFDESSFNATTRELRTELEKLDIIVRPTFEIVTKELGIREIAVIADLSLLEQQVAAIVAIPWKDKTTEQLKAFHSLLTADNVPPNFFGVDGFLILPLAENSESTAELVETWVQNVTPEPNSPIFDALKSVVGAEVKLAVTVPERLRFLVRNGVLPQDAPNEIKGLLLFVSQKIQWASAALPLGKILDGGSPRNIGAVLTIKAPKESDAVQLRGMLEQAIEFGVNAWRFSLEQEAKDDFRLPPLFFQFAKGFLRTLLPKVEGDKLVVRF